MKLSFVTAVLAVLAGLCFHYALQTTADATEMIAKSSDIANKERQAGQDASTLGFVFLAAACVAASICMVCGGLAPIVSDSGSPPLKALIAMMLAGICLYFPSGMVWAAKERVVSTSKDWGDIIIGLHEYIADENGKKSQPFLIPDPEILMQRTDARAAEAIMREEQRLAPYRHYGGWALHVLGLLFLLRASLVSVKHGLSAFVPPQQEVSNEPTPNP